MDAFWHRVKVRIKEKSVTQDVAARAIGLTPNKFRVWMSKGMIPPLSYAYKLSRYLDISLEYLISGEDIAGTSQIKTNKKILVLLKGVDKKLAEMRQNSYSVQ